MVDRFPPKIWKHNGFIVFTSAGRNILNSDIDSIDFTRISSSTDPRGGCSTLLQGIFDSRRITSTSFQMFPDNIKLNIHRLLITLSHTINNTTIKSVDNLTLLIKAYSPLTDLDLKSVRQNRDSCVIGDSSRNSRWREGDTISIPSSLNMSRDSIYCRINASFSLIPCCYDF